MGERLALQAELVETLGSSAVYFQEPPNTGMVYPCILYKLDDAQTFHASNGVYNHTWGYQATLMDPDDPDTPVKDALLQYSWCSFVRFYVEDNINHYVFNLYY